MTDSSFPYLTTAQAARIVCCSNDTVLDMIHADVLPAVRVGKAWAIKTGDINAYYPVWKRMMRERRRKAALARWRRNRL